MSYAHRFRPYTFVHGKSPREIERKWENSFTLIQVLPLSVNIMKVACAYMTEKSEIQDDDDEENKRVDMKPYISRSVKPRLDYTQTDWYLDYVNIFRTSNPIFFIRWEKKFRRKFRVPHYFFIQTVKWVKTWRLDRKDAFNRGGVPAEILVLGTLKILANGETFDSVAEKAHVGSTTLRVFFHEFISKFAEEMYPIYCYPPTTDEDIDKSVNLYEINGFPGCVGSVDVTHITWWTSPENLKQ